MATVVSSPTTITLEYNVQGSNYTWTTNPVNNTTFTIPSGVYVSGLWTISYAWSGTFCGNTIAAILQGSSGATPYDTLYEAIPPQLADTVVNVPSPVGASNLAAINAAAGHSPIWCYIESAQGAAGGTVGPITTLTLTLTEASTGGSPTQYTVTGTSTGDGCATITVTMLDMNGNLANAPMGGQVFTSSTTCSGANFNPYILTIPSGSSSGTITYCNQNSGTCTITTCPGAGPLVALPCVSIPITISGAPTDPETAVCQITRPIMREAIRHKLGIVTPLDSGLGNAGDGPRGQAWPTNVVINEAIADAIRDINTQANLHTLVQLTTPIAAYAPTFQGPAQISLAGDPQCPTRLSINNIRRCVYTDNQGNIYRLRPSTYYDHDKNYRDWDVTYAASYPMEFAVEGYQVLIWPAPLNPGTLSFYAGTAFMNFASDNDWLDQLPIDYSQVVEDRAVMRLCMTRPNEPNYVAMYKMYQAESVRGIQRIIMWYVTINQTLQVGLSVDKGRRRRVR